MRFQVTNPDITSLSIDDESHDVFNGVVEVPTTDEARGALQPLIDRGVLIGLPDESDVRKQVSDPSAAPPADESGEEKKSAAKKAK